MISQKESNKQTTSGQEICVFREKKNSNASRADGQKKDEYEVSFKFHIFPIYDTTPLG
jgi:hypothetical protein